MTLLKMITVRVADVIPIGGVVTIAGYQSAGLSLNPGQEIQKLDSSRHPALRCPSIPPRMVESD